MCELDFLVQGATVFTCKFWNGKFNFEQMVKWHPDKQVAERLQPLKGRVRKQLKAMEEFTDIHDPNAPGEAVIVPYDLKAYAFFEEYKKDLDADRALKTLNIPRATYNQWLLEPKFTDVVNRIHKAYEDAVLMDAKTIAGWSVEILRDMHQAFKAGDSKVSAALANMAGNMLRASGNFKEGQAQSAQVLIQINTGGTQTTPTGGTQAKPEAINATPKQTSSINLNIQTNEQHTDIANLPILCGEK